MHAERSFSSYSAEPPRRIRFPVMYQSWRKVTFLHWGYDPEIIDRHVPRHLEVDTFDDRAWVTITPFLLTNLHPPALPPLPWISTSPETNVRTYVRGPSGDPGILFFSLDIARLPAALVGRTAYSLPYMWADMTVQDDGNSLRYTGQRRWPGKRASYDIAVEPGAVLRDDELSDLDHFLTARFVLFNTYGPLPGAAFAEHPPWPLARARLVRLTGDLLGSADLPPPTGKPLVHFSPGVDVRISRPHIAAMP